MAGFHIAAGVAHVKNRAAAHLSYLSKPICFVDAEDSYTKL